MVILESDWYRESLEYNLNMEKLQELLITRKFISLLILESDRYEISEKNPRKKLFRPCDFFKSHKWIKIYPKQRFFTTITKNTIQEKTILFLEPKRILIYSKNNYQQS